MAGSGPGRKSLEPGFRCPDNTQWPVEFLKMSQERGNKAESIAGGNRKEVSHQGNQGEMVVKTEQVKKMKKCLHWLQVK